MFKKIEKVQKSRKKEYSKSINREKIEKEYSNRHYPEVMSSLSGSPEVKSSLSGSSHIAVTIIRNLVLMANYSISTNVFCLFAMSSQGKTQRQENRKKKPSCKKKNSFLLRSIPAHSDVTEIYAQSNMKTIITWGIVFIYKCA